MIRAEFANGNVSIVGDVPPGWHAYVDADWLPSHPRTIPSVSVAEEGRIAWCDETPIQTPENLDSDTVAALALLAVARDAATAATGIAGASIEVVGRGLIARLVRALLEDARETAPERPRAIVDTTGDPAVILDATRRVADLGSVVLVGESLGRELEINLYPDVHARSLTVVGIPPVHGPIHRESTNVGLLEACRESLVRVPFGSPLLPDALWYRVPI